METVDLRINNWKKKLLDLGKRNRLINYKETKRSNIQIISPNIEEIYKQLVINEETLNFPYILEEETDDDDLVTGTDEKIIDGDIITNRSFKEMQKTLGSLRSKAKTAIEEQGVNILYLSLGFLKWKERNDSNQILTSPLVLVPVTLTLKSLTSPFMLGLHDDEIVVNPTLIHKLDNDYGIVLPTFDSQEDNIIDFLNIVKDKINKTGWIVSEEIGLSLLSFHKINMYMDLEKNKPKLVSHPIIKALSSDTSEITLLSEEYNDFDHDRNTRPIDTYQILDADSSQQDAILYSKKEVSFVLQGPPGTGKSQTITNIIAEALSEGKKVLFVSEKMAALEVVHKRLSQIGLDDFCLTLHSHKANKKEVLKELGKNLNLDKIRLQDDTLHQLDLLETERRKLNAYVEEIHTVCYPLGKSIYEINGRLAKLNNVPDIIFPIDDVSGTTNEKLNEYIYLLNDLTKTLGKMKEDFESNPWRESIISNISHELRHDIERNLKQLIPSLKSLVQNIDGIVSDVELNWQMTLNSVNELIELLEITSKSPKIPVEWIYEEDIANLLIQAENYRNLKAEYFNIYNNLSQKYSEDFFKLPANDILNKYNLAMMEAKKLLNSSSYISEEKIIDSLEYRINLLQSSISGIEIINEVEARTKEILGIKQIENIETAISLANLMKSILTIPKPTIEWFDSSRYSIVKNVFKEAKETYKEYKDFTEKLLKEYEKEIFDIDSSEMLIRFKTEYSSFFKIFKKNYRSDKRLIKSYSKVLKKNIDDQEIINILNNLKYVKEKKLWIKENSVKMETLFGTHFLDEYTNWDELGKSINNFNNILKYYSPNGIDIRTKDFLLSTSSKVEILNSLYEQINTVLESNMQDELTQQLNLVENIEDLSLESLNQNVSKTLLVLQSISAEYEQMKRFSKDEKNIKDLTNDFMSLIRMQEIKALIEQQEEDLKNYYHFLYNGIATDWDAIISSLAWASDFRKLNMKHNLSSSFIDRICKDDFTIDNINNYLKTVRNGLVNIKNEIDWYISLFDSSLDLMNMNLNDLIIRMEKSKNNLSALEEWIDFRKARDKCKEAGLTDFIEKIETYGYSRNVIVPTFLKRFYRLWLDKIILNYPSVDSFRRRIHDENIKEFNRLDMTQLSIARLRIKANLISKLPDMNKFTSAFDEVGILKRELNKQRKIMPLRKLFREIPNLLLNLKPCLMMSPLSVSLFLDTNNYKFDIVIFDEASQVRTEDAVGAIMRGTQVIIAGDSKQLPPTNFFALSTSDGDFDTDDEEDETYNNSEGYESILDEAVTILPERTLRWHYRSRHEDLIAFSNAKVYGNNLITFPSYIEKLNNYGVEYIFVANGVYDRSGKRDNPIEANKVAELVFEHIKEHPKRSLGVVTFSEAQQQAVEVAIRRLRLRKPQFEPFFAENKEEKFFVKNLENVQGDERDTIIFSIGYAKDHNGVMYMNFGPLSRDGGFRRLNVAITRAKYNIKLVGSIRPTDINIEKTNSEGVKMLRSYIEFAINGAGTLRNELIVNDIVNVESPFEEAVYDFLVGKGYQVATQVGCSGYRIDLAVKHPTLSGRFVLGIECDGATYHSARTARERDRLRQTVLEDIGWKIYRIWSTDWIKDPITEGEKLFEVVEQAITEYKEHELFSLSSVKKHTMEDINFILTDLSSGIVEDDIDDNNHYDFNYYEEADVYEIYQKLGYNPQLKDILKSVVEKEYPIHEDLLAKRLAILFGNQKATVKVKDSLKYVFERNLKNEIEFINNFYWLKGNSNVKVRVPNGEEGYRIIENISVEELAEAMFIIANKSFGIMKNDLFILTARTFGFNRTGSKINLSLENAFKLLIKTNRIIDLNEKITINEKLITIGKD